MPESRDYSVSVTTALAEDGHTWQPVWAEVRDSAAGIMVLGLICDEGDWRDPVPGGASLAESLGDLPDDVAAQLVALTS